MISLYCFQLQEELFNNISEENQIQILTYVHDVQSKNEQHLQLLINAHEVKQRCPQKKENALINSYSFKYHAMVSVAQTEVCLKAFLSLHAVTKKRVERIRNLKICGMSPTDKRGCHVKKAFTEATKLHIRQHIESFPTKESHYLGRPLYHIWTY